LWFQKTISIEAEVMSGGRLLQTVPLLFW